MELKNFLQNCQDYIEVQKEEITFYEYLEKVKGNRLLARNAHTRLRDMIESYGKKEKNGKTTYSFFENTIFGLEQTIQELMDTYIIPAAENLSTKKRLLLLVGPVSSGKSTIANVVKKGLEAYSKTDEGAIYTIKGCPMNQDPLLLIPMEQREVLEKEWGIQIEGELNPYTRKLMEDTYQNNLENVKVERLYFSEKERKGIGTFTPSDPKSQDISELIGGIDFSKITTYGSESHPYAYRFDGELNIANRGMIEFQELLKCDTKFMWQLLSLTQEGNFKTPRFSLISTDEVVFAHTNETEFQSFVNDKRNEALLSRMVVIKVPYNVSLTDEVRTYQKLVGHSYEFSPYALEMLALFSLSTRVHASSRFHEIDEIEKIQVYEANTDVEKIEALQQEFSDDGMFGIDPRFVMNCLDTVVCKYTGRIELYDILDEIEKEIRSSLVFQEKEKELYLERIIQVKKQFRHILKKEVNAFVENKKPELLRQLAEKFLQEVKASLHGNPYDKLFVKKIESSFNLSSHEKETFREELVAKLEISLQSSSDETGIHNNLPILKELEKQLSLHALKPLLDDEKNMNAELKLYLEKNNFPTKHINEILKSSLEELQL